MKKFTLFLVVLCLGLNLNAQDCMPAENLPDSAVAVVPAPYHPELTPMGGISDTACLNEYYEFTFTIVTPAEFDSPIGPVPIDSIVFATEGALSNLPGGFDYVCNPPNCSFQKDSIGCVKIFGTATDPADVDTFDIMIAGKIHSVLDFDLIFPNEALFPGNYFLFVKPEGDPNCLTIDTEDNLASRVSINNAPNPFSGNTQIFINSDVTEKFTFQVHDLLGQQIHQERVQIVEGENTINYDGHQLPNGIYIYSIDNGAESVSKKMIVNR